jgi:hypothetical protein
MMEPRRDARLVSMSSVGNAKDGRSKSEDEIDDPNEIGVRRNGLHGNVQYGDVWRMGLLGCPWIVSEFPDCCLNGWNWKWSGYFFCGRRTTESGKGLVATTYNRKSRF